MVAAPTLITLIKYAFLSLVVTGAGFLIANTAVMIKYKLQSEKLQELRYKPQSSPMNASSEVDRNSMRCLTHPSRPFCLMSSKKRLQLLNSRHLDSGKTQHHNVPPVELPPAAPVYLLMLHFQNLMNSFNIQPILLEPSILFCMLPALQKYALISSGLNTNVLQGSLGIINFGIFEKDAEFLNNKTSFEKILASGYEISIGQKWFEISSRNDTIGDFYPTRFFFSKDNITVNMMIFYQRHNFLWYPGSAELDLPVQNEPFTKNCLFENFTSVPFYLENGNLSGFHFPSHMDLFLKEIQNAEFEECQMMAASSEDKTNQLHPFLTKSQLEERALIAIQELKSNFKPKMIDFWMWKDTLNGWQERCNIFHETSDFSVAVQSSFISKVNLTSMFAENNYLNVLEYHQWEDVLHKIVLECHGLIINIFPTYEDYTSLWYFEGNFTSEIVKITYSKFKLCSTDFLGQLIYKPCDNSLKREINSF